MLSTRTHAERKKAEKGGKSGVQDCGVFISA